MHVVTELKGVHKVRKKLASGKIVYYYYAWRGGPRASPTGRPAAAPGPAAAAAAAA